MLDAFCREVWIKFQGAEQKVLLTIWATLRLEKRRIFFNVYFGGFAIYVHMLENSSMENRNALHLFWEVSENRKDKIWVDFIRFFIRRWLSCLDLG